MCVLASCVPSSGISGLYAASFLFLDTAKLFCTMTELVYVPDLFSFGVIDGYRHIVVHMAHPVSQVVLSECIKCVGTGRSPSNLSCK